MFSNGEVHQVATIQNIEAPLMHPMHSVRQQEKFGDCGLSYCGEVGFANKIKSSIPGMYGMYPVFHAVFSIL